MQNYFISRQLTPKAKKEILKHSSQIKKPTSKLADKEKPFPDKLSDN